MTNYGSRTSGPKRNFSVPKRSLLAEQRPATTKFRKNVPPLFSCSACRMQENSNPCHGANSEMYRRCVPEAFLVLFRTLTIVLCIEKDVPFERPISHVFSSFSDCCRCNLLFPKPIIFFATLYDCIDNRTKILYFTVIKIYIIFYLGVFCKSFCSF